MMENIEVVALISCVSASINTPFLWRKINTIIVQNIQKLVLLKSVLALAVDALNLSNHVSPPLLFLWLL